jgi:hypothetical protein
MNIICFLNFQNFNVTAYNRDRLKMKIRQYKRTGV